MRLRARRRSSRGRAWYEFMGVTNSDLVFVLIASLKYDDQGSAHKSAAGATRDPNSPHAHQNKTNGSMEGAVN
jgi:hypothetical protein